MGTRWSGMLAPVGVRNDDMRRVRFAENALDTRQLPIGILWIREESVAHDSAVIVGTIDEFSQTSKVADGAGELFDDPDTPARLKQDVEEFKLLAKKGVIGLSVRLEPEMDMEIVKEGTDEPFDPETEMEQLEAGEIELEMLVKSATVMNAAAGSGPAFGETLGKIVIHDDVDDDDDDVSEQAVDGALTATVTGSTSLPIADTSRSWSGSAATKRMLAAGAGTAARGHFYRDPEGDPESQSTYKLPFADVIDGTLTIVPRGVAAATGGRGIGAAGIPESEKATIRNKICRIYSRIQAKDENWPDCPFNRSEQSIQDEIEKLEEQFADAALPSMSWFQNPKLPGPTPITFADDGRVYGHLAVDGTCHTGKLAQFGVCVTPPQSSVDFAHFNRHPVLTDDGVVWAGRLTAGGNHPSEALSRMAAERAYDEKTTAAYVVAGRDDYGIWIAGALEPDLDDATLSILSRRKISGDWRETPDGLELIEAMALQAGPKHLSEPGFPITVHFSGERQTALIACFGVAPAEEETIELTAELMEIDYDRLGASVAKALREHQAAEEHRAALMAAIEAEDQAEREAKRAELATAIGAE